MQQDIFRDGLCVGKRRFSVRRVRRAVRPFFVGTRTGWGSWPVDSVGRQDHAGPLRCEAQKILRAGRPPRSQRTASPGHGPSRQIASASASIFGMVRPRRCPHNTRQDESLLKEGEMPPRIVGISGNLGSPSRPRALVDLAVSRTASRFDCTPRVTGSQTCSPRWGRRKASMTWTPCPARSSTRSSPPMLWWSAPPSTRAATRACSSM